MEMLLTSFMVLGEIACVSPENEREIIYCILGAAGGSTSSASSSASSSGSSINR